MTKINRSENGRCRYDDRPSGIVLAAELPKVKITSDICALKLDTIQALAEAGAADPQAAWNQALEAGMAGLGAWMLEHARRAAGLTEATEATEAQPAPPPPPPPPRRHRAEPAARRMRSDNRTGFVGIDKHRGRYRARCYRAGEMVFCQSFDDLSTAVNARGKFLAGRAA